MKQFSDECLDLSWEANASLEDRVRVALYENQLRIDPTNLWCRQTLFQLYFNLGAYELATQEMGIMVRYKRPSLATLSQPPWIGTPLRGKTIAITDDWGFGDAIQYIRYLPFLKERGARILLSCRPELLRLFRSMPCIDQIVLQDITSVEVIRHLPFDVYASVIDLPLLLDKPLDKTWAARPYLSVPQTFQKEWCKNADLPIDRMSVTRDRLRQRVGIIWRTGTEAMSQRSCHAADFLPLADLPSYQFYSLQKGRRMEEAGDVPGLIPLGHRFNDFAEAGAAALAMDLVITVDTAMAHLAGALGQEVWVLLPFHGDARWSKQPRRSRLYPRLRLYRQPAPGDWKSVMIGLRRALQRRSATLRKELAPG